MNAIYYSYLCCFSYGRRDILKLEKTTRTGTFYFLPYLHTQIRKATVIRILGKVRKEKLSSSWNTSRKLKESDSFDVQIRDMIGYNYRK